MSEVHLGIVKALTLPDDASAESAAAVLGNGSRISAQDAVPFALWAATSSHYDFQNARWKTVSGLGDRDTTCAMVGGIVVMSAGIENIPPPWIEAQESIPAWFADPRP
jgi:ADP-ribosylglycohydrolase